MRYTYLLLLLLSLTTCFRVYALQPGDAGWDTAILTFKDAKAAADQGDAYANAIVSLHYELGWQTEKSMDNAVKYASASTQAGNPLGMYRFGALMRSGACGVQKDAEGIAMQIKSLQGIGQMGQNRNPYAITSIGVVLFQGKLVPENRAKAALYYKTAADLGYAPAKFNYAMCAYSGHGIDKNIEIAHQYIDALIKEKYPLALAFASEHSGEFDRNLNIEQAQWMPLPYKTENHWFIEFEKGRPRKFEKEPYIYEKNFYEIPGEPSDSIVPQNPSWYLDSKGNNINRPIIVNLPANLPAGSSRSPYEESKKYNIENRKSIVEINAASQDCNVIFSNNGLLMATINADCFKIWDTQTQSCVWSASIGYNVNSIESAYFDSEDNLIVVGFNLTMKYKHQWKKFHFYRCDIRKKCIYEQIEGLTTPGSVFKSSGDSVIWQGKYKGVYGSYIYNSKSNTNILLFNLNEEDEANILYNVVKNRFLIISLVKEIIDLNSYHLSSCVIIDINTKLSVDVKGATSLNISVDGEENVVIGCLNGCVKMLNFNNQNVEDVYQAKSTNVSASLKGEITQVGFDENGQRWWAIDVHGNVVSKKIKFTKDESNKIQEFNIGKYERTKKIFLTGGGDLLFFRKNIKGVSLSLFRWDNKLFKCSIEDLAMPISEFEYLGGRSYEIVSRPPSKIFGAETYIYDSETHKTTSLPKGWFMLRKMNSKVLWFSPERKLVIHNYLSGQKQYLPDIHQYKKDYHGFRILPKADENYCWFDGIDGLHVIDLNQNREVMKVGILLQRSEKKDFSTDETRRERIGDFDSLFYSNNLDETISFGTKKFNFSNLKFSENNKIFQGQTNLPDIAKLIMHNPTWESLVPRLTNYVKNRAGNNYLPILFGSDESEYKQYIIERGYPYVPMVGLSPTGRIAAICETSRYGDDFHLIDRSNKTILEHRGQYNVSSSKNIKYIKPLDDTGEKLFVCSNNSLILLDYKNNKILSAVDIPSIYAASCSSDAKKIFVETEDGMKSCYGWNDLGEIIPQFKFAVDQFDNWIVSTFDGYYMTKGGEKLVAISLPSDQKTDGLLNPRAGLTAFPSDQFSLRLNRPDIVLDKLGAPQEAINIAKELRVKRLKRMGVTEDMLQPDFHLPVISFVSDVPLNTDLDALPLNILAKDTKYKLERLHVYVNNVPINGRNGESLRGLDVQELSKKLSINLAAGSNKIQVSVVNSAGAESLYATAVVTCSSVRPKPVLYIIALGVSEYANSDWNLRYASKDAKDIVARIHDKAGNSYREVKSLCLTDREVTKNAIGAIREMLSKTTIDDTVVMFVAGHGLLDSKYDYYFGTSDIDFDNPSEKGIAFEEFDDLLAEMPCLRKSLLIDTCHAGELDEDEKKALATSQTAPSGQLIAMHPVGARGMSVKPIEGARGKSEWYDRLQGLFVDLRRGSGSTILSSSAGAEYALESNEQQNGLFTYAVLEALDGTKDADANKDGSVQMSELGEYVKKRVAGLTNNKQTPNTRRVNLEGDFVLSKSK
jgi:TPR repeat protein